MSQRMTTMNVRHKVGLLGKLVIFATPKLARVGVIVPLPFVIWAVEHSSYVSVNRGRWRKVRLGLRVEDGQC